MKTLIIKYFPSGENSNTRKLYSHLLERKDNKLEIEEFDLISNKVPIFKQDSITAYYLRNYLGKELNETQKTAIQPFDKIGEKVKTAELLVFTFPMHNFSLPGIVKTFFDSFMFNGEFFNISDLDKKQAITNKKVIVLYSHGGNYPVGTENEKYDFVRSLLKQEFSFMGITNVDFISYSTADSEKKDINLQAAIKQLDNVLDNL